MVNAITKGMGRGMLDGTPRATDGAGRAGRPLPNWCHIWHHGRVVSVAKILQRAASNPANVRFADLMKLCGHHFGTHRQVGSHCVFKTPWPGDPRVNIQDRHGYVAPYQVRQVLAAIEQLNANE